MREKYLNFRSVADKYASSGDDVNIAIGVRPSGRIHLGNMSTLALSGYLGKNIGPHLSVVNVTICDLELPDFHDRNINDNFIRYYAELPDPRGEYNNLLEASHFHLGEFFGAMKDYFGVPVRTHLLSNIQRNQNFRKGLKRLLDEPNSMSIINPSAGKKSFVFPICPDCKTSSNKTSLYNNKTETFKATCKNPECSREAYDMNIFDLSRDLSVHYFIDPLRDCWVDPKPQIHVFGGDYRMRGKNSNTPQIKGVIDVMKTSGGCSLPDILLGPNFFSSDGYKMSKGRDNGLTLDILKRHFGEDAFLKIFELTEKIMERDMKVVDYSFIEDFLF